ncbi:DUF2842 domain-containing protein [Pseudaestuariivita rosea]|uniref:DUF2842 domain-containing protein n=1 Tax=Pseudaestuariivita rosea TaxID=2763263 RepID=UPI001ABABCD8|nr:DUF2842 domain-containing protein [Pseudaestuariivita rosea]
MPLSYKTRKRLSLFILVVGIPAYIVICVSIINWLYPDPLTLPPWWAQLLVYVTLGVVWAFPLKFIFKGIGREDPDAPPQDQV